MVKGGLDYNKVVDRVLQPGLYGEAMRELGVAVAAKDMQPVKLADGMFDPRDPERYAKSFAVHSLVA
jgi:hypothetical protein